MESTSIWCDIHVSVGHTEADMAYLCSPNLLPRAAYYQFLEKYKRSLIFDSANILFVHFEAYF